MVPLAALMLVAVCAAQEYDVFSTAIPSTAGYTFTSTGLSLHNEKEFTAGVPNVTAAFASSNGTVLVLALTTPAAPDVPTVSASWSVQFPTNAVGSTTVIRTARHIGAFDGGVGVATAPGLHACLSVCLAAAWSPPLSCL